MATVGDIALSAVVNILTALAFLLVFAILRLQPLNDRVYFPKWYIKGLRCSPINNGAAVGRVINLSFTSYLRFLSWLPQALKMPELELIEHAGLDSVVYLRIYLLGLKIFVPITLLAFAILVPVNWTGDGLTNSNFVFSDIDKLSISNIPSGSERFWTHVVMAYVFIGWTCYTLKKEYELIATMRLSFLASQNRRPDQFTVLVRNVPPDPDESVSESVEHFFLVNHPNDYLTYQIVYNANKLAKIVDKMKKKQNWLDYYKLKYERNSTKRPIIKTGFWGLWGKKVDAIDHYVSIINKLSEEESLERDRMKDNPKVIMPASFVSFKTRWGAAVCAQTQQSRNPTLWLTDWAPEPRDVYWKNLAIPFVSLTIRRLLMAVAFFFLIFFFMVPIAFVQSLASIEGIQRRAAFLNPLIEMPIVKSFIQGVLPGLVLKIFLILLPSILLLMSKIEGHISISTLERKSASKFYVFNLINVFLVNVIAGAAFEQLNSFIHQSATDIPRIIGVAIPMRATFFITYIMIDGWAGISGEILRLKALVFYHIKNLVLVKTEKDRDDAMDPGSILFHASEPKIQLYFLLGLVYMVVTPILLPFILVFFGLAFVVYRHQIINVYDQEYESAASFWPAVHGRVVTAMAIAEFLLLGLMGSKEASKSTPFLIALPVLTIWFHWICKTRYESAFAKYPLQEAMMKDTLDKARYPDFNMKEYFRNAYMHPVLKDDDNSNIDDYTLMGASQLDQDVLVKTKRQSAGCTPLASKRSNDVAALPSSCGDIDEYGEFP